MSSLSGLLVQEQLWDEIAWSYVYVGCEHGMHCTVIIHKSDMQVQAKHMH